MAIEVSPVKFPVPDRLAVCGLLLAESITVSLPVRVPVIVGVKVTLMVQLAPAESVPGQAFVWAKSPVTEMPEMVTAELRLLVKVKAIPKLVVPTIRLGNVAELGDRATGRTPVPLRLIVCGLLLALSLIVTEPVAVPVVEGLNVMLIVQLAPASTDVPQVLV